MLETIKVFGEGALYILLPAGFACGFVFGFIGLCKAVRTWEDQVFEVAKARADRDAERWARRIRPGVPR